MSEIKKVARKQPVLAADGAVAFFEKVSPALERIDSSSGAIGAAVNNATAALVAVIADAPADAATRDSWLERLYEAHAEDRIPYIELLADYWGDLCASAEVASAWADRLVGITRKTLSPDRKLHGHFHGTSACLSALYRAERYGEVVDLVSGKLIWEYKRWAVKALAAQGQEAEAIRYAEACRSPWANDPDIDRLCEEILLSSGSVDEAYARYACSANCRTTYLSWFRAVAKKYPDRAPAEVLDDLVEVTPGSEGKWFAAAKAAKLFDEAIGLASRSPCDPKTLTRAAKDFAASRPEFAVEAGLLALHWLVEGYGYEITGADVLAAYYHTLEAAEHNDTLATTRDRIQKIVAAETAADRFVSRALGSALGPR